MKALSIQQPWAYAILFLGKDIENRGWKTNYRGRFLIHASRTYDKYADDWFAMKGIKIPTELDAGGIVGSVEIIDCVESSDSEWFFGRYGFVLRKPIVLPFMPALGRLGFFEVEYNNS